MLGFTDRGWFTFALMMDYGGSVQGFAPASIRGPRGLEIIEGILKTVGVDEWEKLSGKPVRVKVEGSEFNGFVRAVGNYLDDKWLDLREFDDRPTVENLNSDK